MDPKPLGIARNHDELVELLAQRKADLGLSNEFVDQIGGLAAGACDQILGPSRRKNLGKTSMDILLEVFAADITLTLSTEKLRRMEKRYEGRVKSQVRQPPNGRVSKHVMKRVAPLVRKEFAQSGVEARMAMLTSEHRSGIARKAAKTRWRKRGGG
jgi:hypothetical protein